MPKADQEIHQSKTCTSGTPAQDKDKQGRSGQRKDERQRQRQTWRQADISDKQTDHMKHTDREHEGDGETDGKDIVSTCL